MPISPGSHIGPYEVTGHLGEGGMGVVYRGRDSRLQRDVALKLLPENFASDPDRMSRFQREAQVLASLNHANIAQIYGLEHVEGSACIVMELVEGETLADKLKKGPFSFDEALDVARQIADALSAAHERGIVHRDLKPANIKLTPNGTVKVLDFGLAKALGPKTDASLTAMPTVASGSMVGAVVGTPGYMSPEQARGKEVDARTDIWAFGCVLYEMLTARQAFEGETVTDIMAKIVTSSPDLDLLPRNTPSSVRLLLTSVLNKNTSQRLQHIGDTRLFLDGTLAAASAPKTDAEPVRRDTRGNKPIVAVLVVAFLAAAVPAVLYFRNRPQTAQPMQFELSLPGSTAAGLVSPNGQSVAYVAPSSDGRRSLWIRSLGTGAAQQVAGTEDLSGPLWAPDSRHLAINVNGKLKKVSLDGGSVQPLADLNPRGADWNSAGVILMGRLSDNVIVRMSDSGGEITPVTKLDASRKELLHALPVFLPDGNHFVYVAVAPKPEDNGIFLTSLDSKGPPTQVIVLEPMRFNGMAYASGYLLIQNNGKLTAQKMDPGGRVQGEPIVITEELDASRFAVSNNGLLLYHKEVPVAGKQLVWFSHDGKKLGEVGAPANYNNIDLSPKGDRVAVDKITDNNRDIWVIDLDRAVPSRISFDTGQDWSPTWSPDGTTLMYAAAGRSADNITRILEKSSTGAGMETRVDVGNASSIPVHWSPDGKYLVYSRLRGSEANSGFEPWILPLFGERKPTKYVESPVEKFESRISPDGRFMAYVTNESGSNQIVVQTFPDPNGGKWPISADGGIEPKWRHDGRELYYIAFDGKLMSVPITGGATFQAGRPTALFQTPLTVNKTNPGRDRRYDVAPDGRFLIVAPVAAAASAPTTVVVNWDAALKK